MKAAQGRFKDKHPLGLQADPAIVQAVEERLINGMITCADATDIADDLHKTMQQIGLVLDLLEVSLSKCQLGLFGYDPQKKIVKPATSVVKEMETAITKKLVNGRLSCDAGWKIALELALPKLTVSSACEAMKIKIKPCQLGAF